MANRFIAPIQATNPKCFVVDKNQAKVFFTDPEDDIVNPTLYYNDKIERINDVYLNKSTGMVDNNTPRLMVIE